MKERQSLDRIMEDFNPSIREPSLKTNITIWLPSEYKARYQRLQEKSGRRFSGTLRALIEAAIDHAEANTRCREG